MECTFDLITLQTNDGVNPQSPMSGISRSKGYLWPMVVGLPIETWTAARPRQSLQLKFLLNKQFNDRLIPVHQYYNVFNINSNWIHNNISSTYKGLTVSYVHSKFFKCSNKMISFKLNKPWIFIIGVTPCIFFTYFKNLYYCICQI